MLPPPPRLRLHNGYKSSDAPDWLRHPSPNASSVRIYRHRLLTRLLSTLRHRVDQFQVARRSATHATPRSSHRLLSESLLAPIKQAWLPGLCQSVLPAALVRGRAEHRRECETDC